MALLIIVSFGNTNNKESDKNEPLVEKPKISLQLDLKEANKLAQLPLNCINHEYPYNLGQVLGGPEDLKTPTIELHPAFYGCYDWHSAVHAHWSLVSLLKQFPSLEKASKIKEALSKTLSAENSQAEIDYFSKPNNTNFERTYGWAWNLKLAEALYSWDDDFGQTLYKNVNPLAAVLVNKYLSFIPKLIYPVRIRERSNTAFGLSFAYDFAITTGHQELQKAIEYKARVFYYTDKNCPIEREPDGYDFLSPCLEEAGLMKKILKPDEYENWLQQFLPQLSKPDYYLEPGKRGNRSDSKLVHLDGVNFSRAWNFSTIAQGIPQYHHLQYLAQEHIQASLPSIVNDSYEGGHWLGSFCNLQIKNTSRK